MLAAIQFGIFCLPFFSQRIKDEDTQNYDFTCCFL
jgi:hypothetical protein